MAIRRDRKRQVTVGYVVLTTASASAVLQIGDVKNATPYARSKALSAERGAVSFVGGEFAEYQETGLHFVNHRDREDSDQQLLFGHLDEPFTLQKERL